MRRVVDQFAAAGFSERSALAKAELLGRCLSALGRTEPPFVLFVPGRVEVLGKHTDYAGGRSLTCAIDRGFVVAVRPRTDSHVLVNACDVSQSLGFDLNADLRVPEVGWENYVMTVARRVTRNFGSPMLGADIAFASDLPPASGMSSSSALLIATYLALDCANQFAQRPAYTSQIRTQEDLAEYLGTCENGQSFGKLLGDKGVGTFGGSEDHTAILCSRAGELSVYSYAPVRLERRIQMPHDTALVIASSGVVAEKTAAAREKYNRISRVAGAVMEALREAGWCKTTLAAAINDDREAAECVRQILSNSRHPEFRPAELLARFDQFSQEHQRFIPMFVDALAVGDWAKAGLISDSSQALSETGLKNQIPETVALAKLARQHGALAANAFGAGFGGSVWAMVPKSSAGAFVETWHAAYHAQFPQHEAKSTFFITEPSCGAIRV